MIPIHQAESSKAPASAAGERVDGAAAASAPEVFRRSRVEPERVFFFAHDLTHCFTYVSPSATAVLGYTPEELIGRSYDELLVEGALGELVHARTDEALRSGVEAGAYHAVVRHRSGRQVVLEITETPVSWPDGTVVGMQGMARDVTERECAVERFEHVSLVLESISDCLFRLDRQWRFTYLNRRAESFFGARRGQLLGRTLWNALPDIDQEGVRQLLAQAYDLAEPVTFELTLPAADMWLDCRVHPAEDGLTILLEDTTARHRADAALRASEEQLRHSQKMEAVGRLAGGVAHDFNNLLTTIRGYATFLVEGLDPAAPLRADAEQIVRAASSAADLTRQLLLFSRQKVGQPRIVNVNEIVADMDQLLRRVLGEDIRLEKSLDPQVGAIAVDAGHIEQIIMNLVLNARDAAPEGGMITVATRDVTLTDAAPVMQAVMPPGSYVQLSVSDTGTGIEPSVLPMIFEPFFTTKEPGIGTGLGLATVYGIVRQAGGDIRVTTTQGIGTTFDVLLPCAVGRGPGAQAVPAEAAAAGGQETVLVVEDDDAVRALIVRVLRGYGYTVLAAPNGTIALRVLRESGCGADLVLTDVVMPEMSGRELAEQVRVHCPGVPVLYMSGYTPDEVIRRGVREAEVDLLEKPFTPDTLARAVRRAIDAAADASFCGAR